MQLLEAFTYTCPPFFDYFSCSTSPSSSLLILLLLLLSSRSSSYCTPYPPFSSSSLLDPHLALPLFLLHLLHSFSLLLLLLLLFSFSSFSPSPLSPLFSFRSYGVGSFVLFPKVPDNLKTNYAHEAHNPNGTYVRTYICTCV